MEQTLSVPERSRRRGLIVHACFLPIPSKAAGMEVPVEKITHGHSFGLSSWRPYFVSRSVAILISILSGIALPSSKPRATVASERRYASGGTGVLPSQTCAKGTRLVFLERARHVRGGKRPELTGVRRDHFGPGCHDSRPLTKRRVIQLNCFRIAARSSSRNILIQQPENLAGRQGVILARLKANLLADIRGDLLQLVAGERRCFALSR